jgi:phage protein D
LSSTDIDIDLAPDEQTAKRRAKGRKAKSEREGGGGTVRILLDPKAKAEGTLVLKGTRPGIDGTYRITGVTHKIDRSGGAETTLEIKQPQGEAGKDERASPTDGTDDGLGF